MTAPSAPVVPLTATQQRILSYMADGKSNAVIAALMFCSVGTVKGHQREIYQRLGANGAVNAVHLGHLHGLLGGEGAK